MTHGEHVPSLLRGVCVGIRLMSAVEGICHIWIDQTQKGGTAGQASRHEVKETLEVVL